MKKLTLSISLLFSCLLAFAQPQNYVFTVSNGVNYLNLSAPTIITTTDWDDFTANVPLGFKFHFLDDSTDTFYFDGNEMNSGTDMQFSNSSISSNPFNVITTLLDLEDRHAKDASKNSTVGYQTDLVSGKKVTKIEWRNCGLWDDSTATDSLNMQCWVYEGDDAIEFRIGNSSRADITGIMKDPNIFGFKGPFFGFFKDIDPNAMTSDWIYYVSNTTTPKVDSTDLNTIVNSPGLIGVDSFPNANTLLRWSKGIQSGTNSVQLNDNITVYPTLFSNEFNVKFNSNSNYEMLLVNNNGEIVSRKKMNQNNEKIQTSHLANGNYFIVFSNSQEKIVYQVTKL